ncbi:hypothetical protein [Micropruina sp.]|uniref:hypothetical protein n=1 Tax=Micropruina sp. TaxID=2737536 RepID=UPI0039E36235
MTKRRDWLALRVEHGQLVAHGRIGKRAAAALRRAGLERGDSGDWVSAPGVPPRVALTAIRAEFRDSAGTGMPLPKRR